MKLNNFICAIVAAVAIPGAASAEGDAYPNQDIRLIVPFSPGGNTDILARLVAEPLAEKLGGTIYVDNRPGAGGSVGTNLAAQSEGDGYTLVLVSGSHVFNPSIHDLPYDTLGDFVALGLIAKIPNVLLANSSSAMGTAQDLIAHAKENPGDLNYASAGIGTGAHLSMAYFQSETGIDAVHIPYKGNSNATADLLGAKVDIMMGAQPAAMGHIKSGKLKALAITSTERSEELPDVPTVSECCVEGFEFVQGFGLLSPTGTPEDVIAKINSALQAVLKEPDTKSKLAKLGANTTPTSSEEHQAFIEAEVDRWSKVVQQAGISRQ